jgi:hypothetical protein
LASPGRLHGKEVDVKFIVRFEKPGEHFDVPGRFDTAGQPILPQLGHYIVIGGKGYKVVIICWNYDFHPVEVIVFASYYGDIPVKPS